MHVDPMALRLQMTPVKREKGRDLFFNKLFNWGSDEEIAAYESEKISANMKI